MRSLLVALVVLVLLALSWFWLAPGTAPQGLLPIAAAAGPSEPSAEQVESLDPVPDGAGVGSPETVREALPIGSHDSAPWPDGFSELVVRVVAGKRRVAGAAVEVPGAADAVLNGEADEQGRALTDARGEVRFYVRPTRTVLVSAVDLETARSVEGTYTTPFEKRSRVVELDIGDSGEELSLLILSELNGAPLTGAVVEVLGQRKEATTEATADASGLVLVPDEEEAKYRFTMAGYVTETVRRVEMEAEGAPQRAFRMRPYARVRGKVTVAHAGAAETSRSDFASELKGALRGGHGGEIQLHREQGNGGLESRVVRGNEAIFMVTGPLSTDVQADGTWSIDVAIPKEQSQWDSVRIERMLPNGSMRLVNKIAHLRPGDDVTVDDPWLGAPELTLVLQDLQGAPIAVGKRVFLSPTSVETARRDPVVRGKIRRDGRVHLPAVPVGDWSYVVHVPGAPPSWSLAGSFRHDVGGEPVVLSHSGRPLTVKLAPSRENSLRYFRFGIAEAGQSPSSLIDTHEGGTVTFPNVPADASWELVLIQLTARSFGKLRTSDLPKAEETLRVPLHPDEREVLLRP